MANAAKTLSAKGQSLAQLVQDRGVSISSVEYLPTAKEREEWAETSHWRCTLRYKERKLTTTFHLGKAHTGEPAANDVLGCLLSDVSNIDQPFEAWCGDLGFDTDSRHAERVYTACKAMRPKLEKLLGEDFATFASSEW